MKLIFKLLFTFLLLGGVLISCSSKKKLVEEAAEVKASTLVQAYEKNTLDFDQLEFLSNVKYSGSGMSLDFSGTFRIKKDQKIWASFKKFGFEVARIQITQDSVFVVNRFQQNYIAEDISALKDKSGVPLEFDDFQQLLVGGSFWTDGLEELNDSTLVKVDNIKGEIIEAQHTFDQRNLVRKSKIQSKSEGMLQVEYDQYEMVNNASLAFLRDIQVERDNSFMTLNLKTTNFDFESMKSMPFEIPSNYTRQSM